MLFQIKSHDHQPVPQIGYHVPDHPQFHEDVVGQVTQAEGTLTEAAASEQVEGLVHPLVPRLAEALLVELVALEQIAQRQRDEVEEEHQKRLVFEGEEDAVPTALLAFEGVVPHRAGAGPADVVALGCGAEDVFVARVVGPPTEVYVLEVGEEIFIKDADLVEDALAVEGRAAAGREDALLSGVPAGPASVAGLAGKAHPCDVVAGVVGQLPVEVADHKALDGKDLLVALGGAEQLGQPLRLGKGIVVEQYHELALRPGNALIHGMGEAGVAAVLDEGEVGPAAIAAGLLEALVGGAVVHHDEFEILFGLGVDRLDGVFEPAFAVDVGDDDGRFHSFLCSCAFSCSIQEIV